MDPCRTWQASLVFTAVACAVLLAAQARAQDRMPPIAPDRMAAEQEKAVADFRAARGGNITGPFIPLLRSPEAMTRARAMGDISGTRRAWRRGTAS